MTIKQERIKLPYQDVNLEIEYFIRQGGYKTILYLHGGGCYKEDFIKAAEIKELQDYNLVGFDFPGCGNSSYPEGCSFSVDDLCDITKLIVDYLHLNKMILIGHSMGGLVALLFIRRYDHVDAFINVEGNLSIENCLFSKKIYDKSFAEFSEKIYPELLKKCRCSENEGTKIWLKSLEKVSPKAFYDACPSLVEYSAHGNLISRYLHLKIPTIYLYGSESKERLSFLDNLNETKEIAKSGHFLFNDNPVDYYNAICCFLNESFVP